MKQITNWKSDKKKVEQSRKGGNEAKIEREE